MKSFELISNEKNGIDVLENKDEGIRLKFLRLGAEIVEYKIPGLQNGLFYRDGDISNPAGGWKNHATILFPVVGRLKDNKSKYGKKIISFKKNHGFARSFVFELEKYKLGTDKAMISYSMESNEELREQYPFDFKFNVVYKISGNKLAVKFKVKNRSNDEPIYFSIGWHPGFAVYGKTSFKLKSHKFFYYKVGGNGLLTGEKIEIHKDYFYKLIRGSLNKALIFEFIEKRERSLIFNNGKIDIKLKFRDFPFLGIWSENKDKFICIEPWHGADDFEEQPQFDEKLGIVKLEAGKSKKFKVDIVVKGKNI